MKKNNCILNKNHIEIKNLRKLFYRNFTNNRIQSEIKDFKSQKQSTSSMNLTKNTAIKSSENSICIKLNNKLINISMGLFKYSNTQLEK